MGAAQREPGCGAGEGHLPANVVDIVGRRLTRHGYKLDVMEMDEPVWFAHEVLWETEAGQTPCDYPLPTLVAQVTLTVKHMRQYFSELKVGDIEVIGDYADRRMNINAVVTITSTFANVRARNRNQTCLLPLRHCVAHELASDISSCGAVFSSGEDSLRCCDWWPTCGFNERGFRAVRPGAASVFPVQPGDAAGRCSGGIVAAPPQQILGGDGTGYQYESLASRGGDCWGSKVRESRPGDEWPAWAAGSPWDVCENAGRLPGVDLGRWLLVS